MGPFKVAAKAMACDVSPDGRYVALIAWNGGVRIHDVATGKAKARYALGGTYPHRHVWSLDSSTYAASGRGRIQVTTGADGAVLCDIPVPRVPGVNRAATSMVLTADRLIVPAGAVLHAYDHAGTQVDEIALPEGIRHAWQVALSPDGRWISFVADAHDAILFLPTDGGPARQLAHPAWTTRPPIVRWADEGAAIWHGAGLILLDAALQESARFGWAELGATSEHGYQRGRLSSDGGLAVFVSDDLAWPVDHHSPKARKGFQLCTYDTRTGERTVRPTRIARAAFDLIPGTRDVVVIEERTNAKGRTENWLTR